MPPPEQLARQTIDDMLGACGWCVQDYNALKLGAGRGVILDEIMSRDKVSLDIFWLRDESLDDSATLPHPSVLATEIVEDLRAALAQFAAIADDLAIGEAVE